MGGRESELPQMMVGCGPPGGGGAVPFWKQGLW